MKVGGLVKLKSGLTFVNHLAGLSEAVGVVGDVREQAGRTLITVLYRKYGLMAQDVPAENFEEVTAA